jgi:diguanylate cyclase (GGDEF)-like protein
MEHYFRQLFDNLSLGLLVVDAQFRVQLWNKWLSDKTGISVQKATGKTLHELFPEVRKPRFEWSVSQVVTTRSAQLMSQALNQFVIPIPITSAGRHGLSKMQQSVQLFPFVGDEGENWALICIQDVTEHVIRSSAMTEISQKMRDDSTRDPLTSLYNRRFMWEWMTLQLKQSFRDKHHLACLMFDLDYFKRINDVFGHLVGDEVLKEFSQLIQDGLRESDVLVRYGGEEFVALMPDCEHEEAVRAAERIREATASRHFVSLPEKGQLTCSIGVAIWNHAQPATGEQWLKSADKYLYRAKNAGRNCVKSMSSDATDGN